MTKEELRLKLHTAVMAKRKKRTDALTIKGENEKVQRIELASDFADGSMEAMVEQLDSVCAELPKNKQHPARMEMLRETKRNIMIEEQLNQAQFRMSNGQSGTTLMAMRITDTFLNWMTDGHDRCYAQQVVSQTLGKTSKISK